MDNPLIRLAVIIVGCGLLGVLWGAVSWRNKERRERREKQRRYHDNNRNFPM